MNEIIQTPVTFEELYLKAKSVTNPRKLSKCAEAGDVGAALLSESGQIYTGVCLDVTCGIGFCAEHSAGAAMVTAGENRVLKMIAVGYDGKVLPPCGRCREFISDLHPENLNTEVMVSENVTLSLRELLPHDWRTAAGLPGY
jgi:cytidine deaminase